MSQVYWNIIDADGEVVEGGFFSYDRAIAYRDEVYPGLRVVKQTIRINTAQRKE